MGKVLQENVILGGREQKAGTKESDIPKDIRGQASRFLIDEKKYQPVSKQADNVDEEVQVRIVELEEENSTAREWAEASEKALSEANSSIAGLTSQLEDAEAALESETTRVDEAEVKITELEKTIKDTKK